MWQEEEAQNPRRLMPCFRLMSFSVTSVCVHVGRHLHRKEGTQSQPPLLPVLRELLPHPQSCCLCLSKKIMIQWWVET